MVRLPLLTMVISKTTFMVNDSSFPKISFSLQPSRNTSSTAGYIQKHFPDALKYIILIQKHRVPIGVWLKRNIQSAKCVRR